MEVHMEIGEGRSAGKRVAVYARCSTRLQNPETQLLPLREYCRNRGFSEVTEYVDVGQSGAKVSRPALDRLMKDARGRRIDAILVFRLDRAARSTAHLIAMLEEFRALGVEFISINEQVDTSTPIGKMIFTVIGSIAQLERDIIRERVMAGLERAKAAGVRLGRPRKAVTPDRAGEVYRQTGSVRRAAEVLGVSPATAQRLLQRVQVAPVA